MIRHLSPTKILRYEIKISLTAYFKGHETGTEVSNTLNNLRVDTKYLERRPNSIIIPFSIHCFNVCLYTIKHNGYKYTFGEYPLDSKNQLSTSQQIKIPSAIHRTMGNERKSQYRSARELNELSVKIPVKIFLTF